MLVSLVCCLVTTSVLCGLAPASAQEPTLPVFPQEHIDEAMNDVAVVPGKTTGDCFVFPAGRAPEGTMGASMALQYLALVAHYYPDARSTTGAQVADKVAMCIRTFLTGGQEPGVLGYYGWVQPKAASVLALARNNAAVWTLLSTDERRRADWLMRVFAVVGNFTTNAQHRCRTGVTLTDGAGGFLPNQRGYASVMTYAFAYFGGVDEVNAILAGFDFDEYLARFNEFGWTRLEQQWTGEPETELMMEGSLLEYTDPSDPAATCRVTDEGVRAPYTFLGPVVGDPDTGVRYPADEAVPYEPFELFRSEEAGFMYASRVRDRAHRSSEGCDVVGRLLGESRFVGEIGMAYEFNAHSGRSSMHYVWAGQHIALTHYSTLVALGYWKHGDQEYDRVRDQVWIGNEHYFYEAAEYGWLQSDGQGRCGEVKAASQVDEQGRPIGLADGPSGFKEQKRIYDAMFRGKAELVAPATRPDDALPPELNVLDGSSRAGDARQDVTRAETAVATDRTGRLPLSISGGVLVAVLIVAALIGVSSRRSSAGRHRRHDPARRSR